MSFKDQKFDSKGNSSNWSCKGCTPRNDQHQPNEYGDPCPYADKPLMTENEDPNNNYGIRPTYCKTCGCHYSNGCKEHPLTNQIKLVKS